MNEFKLISIFIIINLFYSFIVHADICVKTDLKKEILSTSQCEDISYNFNEDKIIYLNKSANDIDTSIWLYDIATTNNELISLSNQAYTYPIMNPNNTMVVSAKLNSNDIFIIDVINHQESILTVNKSLSYYYHSGLVYVSSIMVYQCVQTPWIDNKSFCLLSYMSFQEKNIVYGGIAMLKINLNSLNKIDILYLINEMEKITSFEIYPHDENHRFIIGSFYGDYLVGNISADGLIITDIIKNSIHSYNYGFDIFILSRDEKQLFCLWGNNLMIINLNNEKKSESYQLLQTTPIFSFDINKNNSEIIYSNEIGIYSAPISNDIDSNSVLLYYLIGLITLLFINLILLFICFGYQKMRPRK